MLLQSLLDLQERLDLLPEPRDPNTNLTANHIGPKLYRQLSEDYVMDPQLFEQSANRLLWHVEPVGESDNPMFLLLRTLKGMIVITPMKDPDPASREMIDSWVDEYKRRQNPLYRMTYAIKQFFGWK